MTSKYYGLFLKVVVSATMMWCGAAFAAEIASGPTSPAVIQFDLTAGKPMSAADKAKLIQGLQQDLAMSITKQGGVIHVTFAKELPEGMERASAADYLGLLDVAITANPKDTDLAWYGDRVARIFQLAFPGSAGGLDDSLMKKSFAVELGLPIGALDKLPGFFKWAKVNDIPAKTKAYGHVWVMNRSNIPVLILKNGRLTWRQILAQKLQGENGELPPGWAYTPEGFQKIETVIGGELRPQGQGESGLVSTEEKAGSCTSQDNCPYEMPQGHEQLALPAFANELNESLAKENKGKQEEGSVKYILNWNPEKPLDAAGIAKLVKAVQDELGMIPTQVGDGTVELQFAKNLIGAGPGKGPATADEWLTTYFMATVNNPENKDLAVAALKVAKAVIQQVQGINGTLTSGQEQEQAQVPPQGNAQRVPALPAGNEEQSETLVLSQKLVTEATANAMGIPGYILEQQPDFANFVETNNIASLSRDYHIDWNFDKSTGMINFNTPTGKGTWVDIKHYIPNLDSNGALPIGWQFGPQGFAKIGETTPLLPADAGDIMLLKSRCESSGSCPVPAWFGPSLDYQAALERLAKPGLVVSPKSFWTEHPATVSYQQQTNSTEQVTSGQQQSEEERAYWTDMCQGILSFGQMPDVCKPYLK